MEFVKDETSILMDAAENPNTTLAQRRGIMDRIFRTPFNPDLEPLVAHRLEKLRHRISRELQMALRTDS